VVYDLCVVVPGLTEILEPFLQPNSDPFALALPADKMTDDEQAHFPQYAKYVFAVIVLIHVELLIIKVKI